MENMVITRFHVIAARCSWNSPLSDDVECEVFVEGLADCSMLSTSPTAILLCCNLVLGFRLAKCVSPQLLVEEVEIHYIKEDSLKLVHSPIPCFFSIMQFVP